MPNTTTQNPMHSSSIIRFTPLITRHSNLLSDLNETATRPMLGIHFIEHKSIPQEMSNGQYITRQSLETASNSITDMTFNKPKTTIQKPMHSNSVIRFTPSITGHFNLLSDLKETAARPMLQHPFRRAQIDPPGNVEWPAHYTTVFRDRE
ncbi:hypothetical protein CDAR_76211 [Caerostris darwini]|uniref:Uncharacterized protein n=1 Tax=Caerostris darwini TaxID=1538125 RepID=A0AAV4PXD9_9ARAC|nr:hypothetical protein CDAR_76211 [Caerostris darwini]